MRTKRNLIVISVSTVLLFACAYIVTPQPDVTPTSAAAKGWTALVTAVGKSDSGDLRVDITIRNETQDWSSMQASANKPAVLTSGGKTSNCDTVFVGTGGNYLAPGFQMRGYTAGTRAEPKDQLLYVECKGATAEPGSKLSIQYSYVTGPFNYYVTANPTNAELDLDLDQINKDLKYPVVDSTEGLIEKAGAGIVAINDCTLTLTDVKHTATGLQFSWETKNPGAYPTYVHIGAPPVIGADGIIYGYYQSPNLADAPITLPGAKAQWTTDVKIPKDATGLYLLLSVESRQQKLFVSHVVDLAGK
jgi:hypothetical protein